MTLRSLAAMGVVFATACSPCAGTFDCSGDHTLHVEGRIVDPVSGTASPGVLVVLTVDAPLPTDSATTRTADDGTFSLSIHRPSLEDDDYHLTVSPHGDSTFETASLECRLMEIRGSGCPLPVMVTTPYFPSGAFLFYRGTNQLPVENGTVVFHRTSGTHIYGPSVRADSVVLAAEGGSGHLNLLGQGVYATSGNDVVGDLVVTLPPPLDSGVVHGVLAHPTLFFQGQSAPSLIAVGPSLRYGVRFVHASGLPATGVSIRFARTAGVAIDTTGLTATSDSTGLALIDPRALARGNVSGDITVDATSASGSTFIIAGVVLATHDDDAAPTIGTWTAETGAASRISVRRP